MCFANFLFLRGELAAIQFRFGRLEIIDELERLADVVEVGHVNDHFRGDAVLRDEERTPVIGGVRGGISRTAQVRKKSDVPWKVKMWYNHCHGKVSRIR